MMKNAVQEALLIIVTAAAIALVVNALRPEGIRLFSDGDTKTINHQGIVKEIDIEKAVLKFNTQAVLFIDARLPDDYLMGHIRGAINLPDPQFDQRIDDILRQIDPLTEIITYCSGVDCPQAKDLAEKLCQTGYENVLYFPGGYEQWVELELPVETMTKKLPLPGQGH